MLDSLPKFADNVRRLRTQRGLTQEQLAEASGLHLTHVSKIERCLCEPGARSIAKLASGLRISAAPLFEGIDGREHDDGALEQDAAGESPSGESSPGEPPAPEGP